MECNVQVAKWGHSLTIRLPAAVVSALECQVGKEIDITVAGSRDIRVSRKASALATLNALRFRGVMHADVKFDCDDVNAR